MRVEEVQMGVGRKPAETWSSEGWRVRFGAFAQVGQGNERQEGRKGDIRVSRRRKTAPELDCCRDKKMTSE